MEIVIVGAGFAGVRLARKLNNRKGVQVTLIDQNNYHSFQPLFYQVATSGLDASNISFPLRKIFHNSKNVRIRIARLKGVFPQHNYISTDIGNISYDKLVLATGADTNFFGNPALVKHAFPMKSTVEALQIRHRMIQNFEDALLAKSPEELEKLLTVVIVGAGPTGVELAGAIAEMKRYVLPKDYPELDFTTMKIYLVEGTDKPLSAMTPESANRSAGYLKKLGVSLITNTFVKDYNGHLVTLSSDHQIYASLVIWAAGIKGNVPEGIEESLIYKGNRIMTNAFNEVKDLPGIYALGDLAWMQEPDYPNGHPQVAPVAIQQATHLAKNLLNEIKSGSSFSPLPFRYKNKGAMATVGRNLAVVDIPKPKLQLGGFLAWLIWMLLHLVLILGVKNRLFVFLNWVYNYVTYDQSLRLIFKEFYRKRIIEKQSVSA